MARQEPGAHPAHCPTSDCRGEDLRPTPSLQGPPESSPPLTPRPIPAGVTPAMCIRCRWALSAQGWTRVPASRLTGRMRHSHLGQLSANTPSGTDHSCWQDCGGPGGTRAPNSHDHCCSRQKPGGGPRLPPQRSKGVFPFVSKTKGAAGHLCVCFLRPELEPCSA